MKSSILTQPQESRDSNAAHMIINYKFRFGNFHKWKELKKTMKNEQKIPYFA